jgi:ABC-type molybdenum transport system ATPase subunit/photorepair protein PhrA
MGTSLAARVISKSAFTMLCVSAATHANLGSAATSLTARGDRPISDPLRRAKQTTDDDILYITTTAITRKQAFAMRRTSALLFAASRCTKLHTSRRLYSEPIVKITNGTFYRHHPSSNPSSGQDITHNAALFPNLNLALPSFSTPNQHWAILSPSSNIRTAFLQILRGELLCIPQTARTHPYLLSKEVEEQNPSLRYPDRAIEYVGFDVERRAMGGAYLSARYESLKEDTDFTLQRYLTGIMTMNPGEEEIRAKTVDAEVMRKVMHDLELERFLDKPVAMLSNGQSRRARIGKALLTQPLMLCLDAPFIGLDPIVMKHISKVLHRLAEANAPRIVLSLRPQDAVPEWITHIVYAGEDGKVDAQGPKDEVFAYLQKQHGAVESTNEPLDPKTIELRNVSRHLSESGSFTSSCPSPDTAKLSRDAYPLADTHLSTPGEPIVEMRGVTIKYGTTPVLGAWTQSPHTSPGLHFTLRRNSRWGIFGANGSGKTTFLSLVTSDHPQTYSAPVTLFGRSRLPSPGERGITIFEIQAQMGHASPEVHALFPKYLSVRRALESAWAETPIVRAKLDEAAVKRVDAALRWFAVEVNPRAHTDAGEGVAWASDVLFGEVSFSAQRVLLFLRAIIRNPSIVILDEAFSGMDDAARDKCLLFLSRGQSMVMRESEAVKWDGEVVVPGLQEHQALLCVSHSRLEIPGCVREWICLPEPGTGAPRLGRWDGPVELDGRRWDEIWDW